MARQITYETAMSRPIQLRNVTYACDKCGRPISPEEMDDLFANELVVRLNEEECVSTTFRRDYCTECLEPAWLAICEAIGADPDAQGFDRREEDDA
jgi:hypothetical protein